MNEPTLQVNMNPMIDVTFQLLIFFLLTMNLQPREGNLNSYLPKNKGPGDPSVSTREPMVDLVVRLRQDVESGTTLVEVNHQPIASVKNIGPILKREYREIMGIGPGDFMPPVKIDAGDQVPGGVVVRVIDQTILYIVKSFPGARIELAGPQ